MPVFFLTVTSVELCLCSSSASSQIPAKTERIIKPLPRAANCKKYSVYIYIFNLHSYLKVRFLSANIIMIVIIIIINNNNVAVIVFIINLKSIF